MATEPTTRYLTPEQVCEIVPGLTRAALGQMRYTGRGPKYLRPGGTRKILYREADVIAWVEAHEYTRTDQPTALTA